jgi:glyoxylase-like metal-dependent hydrolase (beta-lactamase superfamily II)
VAESQAIAERTEEVVPGIWRWFVHNELIGGAESTSHAVRAEGGCVLVDPVRLRDEALAALAPVEAICLTAQCHQRSAWRYRRELGGRVWAPEGTRLMEEEPDERYREGDVLPGGLQALRTPGPEEVHFSFLRAGGEGAGEPGVLFCSDIFTHYDGRALDFVPFEYHDDPEQTKRTAQALLDVDFDVLCLDHGRPLTDDPKAAIRELLARTK